jgi:hypothetical protein
MDNHTIDHTHSRAICDEVGERLRTQLKPPPPEEKTGLDEKLVQLSAGERKPAEVR